jgi:hypothetical protein
MPTMTLRKSFALVLALAGLTVAGTANAAIIFSDDFDGENGGAWQLDFSSFSQWTVSDGTVDLIGLGSPYDFLPGNGLYVDMDGTSNNAGKLTSIAINLAAGTYTLKFDLAGNRRNGSTESVTVQVNMGSLVNDVISLSQNAPFTTYEYTFTVAAPTVVNLSFEGAGGDNIGMLLDNVSVSIPEPGTLALLGLGLVGAGLARRRAARCA